MDRETLEAAGWKGVKGGGYTGTLGMLWIRGEGTDVTIGFQTGPEHGNNKPGIVHGGSLMTFADIGLGYGVARSLRGSNCVTAHLQMNFVAAAPVGAFVSVRPEIVRRGGQMIFVRGLILADDKTVASADGIWKVFVPKPA